MDTLVIENQKLIDYGKYKYDQRKRQKRENSNKKGKLKEVQLNSNIEQHDLDVKIRNIRRMIEHKRRVMIEVRCCRRSIESVNEIVRRICNELKDIAKKEEEREDNGSLVAYFARK